MKKILFLLALIFLQFLLLLNSANSQNTDSVFDSLSKFSYLIVEASFHPRKEGELPDTKNLSFEGNATGFFVRDSGKLFLYSAYHVFTSCEIYANKRLDSKVDFFIVRTYDTLNKPKYVFIPIHQSYFLQLPCKGFLDQADFASIEVTDYFKGIPVNSIENFFNEKQRAKKNKINKIIFFGYPIMKLSEFHSTGDYDDFVKPTPYFGTVDTISNYFDTSITPRVDSMYIIAKPATYPGSSGAPVFIEKVGKRKKWIEFFGVQSGVNNFYNVSIIAKGNNIASYFKPKKS